MCCLIAIDQTIFPGFYYNDKKQTTNDYMLALGLADNSCPEKLKVHRLTTGCKNIDTFLRGKYEMYKL